MPQPKILVADDSRTIQTLVRRALTEAGYCVSLAADGREAVRVAHRECPQLVILDILMPEMDGYAACLGIRELGEPWHATPFIFLSKVENQALTMLGSQLGAYLPKPVRVDLLLSTVESLIGRGAAIGV